MSIAPIVIDLLMKGMPQVEQSFKGVQDAASRTERAMQREAERGEKARVAASQREARTKEKELAKTAKEADKLQREQTKSAEREAREKARIAERGARENERILLREARDEARIRRQAIEEVDRLEARAVRESLRRHEQAERQKEREAKRWLNKRENQLDGQNRERARIATGIVSGGAAGVMAGMQRAGNIAMGLSTTAMQLGGGFSIADSVMREQNLRKQAAGLSANTILSRAGQPGADASVGGAMSTNDILAKAKALGIQQNIDPADVMAGYNEIKKVTSNVEKATQVMPSVAKLATATDGNVADMAGLAGNILGANPNISNEALESQMAIFARQGVVGGVEVGDFAKYGSRLTAGATKYGGNKEENEATLGAMAQMARQYGSAGTAAEATMGALRFSTDLAKHGTELEGKGIHVTDGKGNLNDAQSVLLEMLKVTDGDVLKMANLGLGDRGVKPLEGVAGLYKNAGGGQAGLDAVAAEFKKYTQGVTKEEVDAAAARVLSEQGAEIEMQKLRIAVGEQLLPEFVKMIPVLRDLIPPLMEAARLGIPAFVELTRTVTDFVNKNHDLIQDIAAHPIGSLIAFEVTKSFATAALPELLKVLMSKAFGVGTGGKGGMPSGVPRAAGGALVAGAAIGGIIYNAGIKYADGTMNADNITAKVQAWKRGERDPERSISPEQASREIQAARERLDKSGGLTNAKNMLESTFLDDDSANKAYGQRQSDRALIDSDALQKAIAEATALGVRDGIARALPTNTGTSGSARAIPIIER